MSRLKWLFLISLRYYRNLGLRVSLYALLSLLAALASPLVERYLGADTTSVLDFDSVLPVLSILATSMLAVSTFSLNIMVSAYRAAAASTTPRVHRILLEDTTSQSVLSTFLGAFVYSLASIVLYQINFYSDETALIVMAVTIFVVVLVILAMLRWVQYLTDLGSVDDSLRAVRSRAAEVLNQLSKTPSFGAETLSPETILPAKVTVLEAPQSGYIQLIDVPRMQECLPDQSAIYIRHRPGAHVLKGQMIAQISGNPSTEVLKKLARAFTLGDQRTFEQDASYGLVVVSETASKALSPGINDMGTAIAAIHSLKELLWDYVRNTPDGINVTAPRVFLPPVDHQALLEAAFGPIGRDGAGTIEVATHLRQALSDLAASGHADVAEAARQTAAQALDHAMHADLRDAEKDQLRQIDV